MKRQLRGSLGAFCVLVLVCTSLSAGTFQTISIDGDTSDWAGVSIAHSDPDDNDPAAINWKDIYIANDADYLYVRVTLWQPADASSFLANYYFDGDNDDATGFQVFGSPDFGSSLLLQSGAGYQQAGGGFNEGSLAASATSFAPLFEGTGTDFEYRIDRNVVGVSGPWLDVPLITSNTVQIQLQTDDGSLDDVAPDAINGIEYTFAVIPEPASLLLACFAGVGLLVRRS